MIETITCADNIARETVSATGVSAKADSDGSITLVWSSEGTSVCVRRCVNGILCDGFKIGSDDLVCDGVTVTASVIIQQTSGELIVLIGFSNGGITSFTQYGEATEMFAYYNFPVVDLKRAVVSAREVLLVLHSNGVLVIVSLEDFLRDPESASTKVVQLGTEEEPQLFTNIEVSCIDENLAFLVQKKSQLLSVTIPEARRSDPPPSSETGILSGIFDYAKSLMAPTVPSPTLRRRKSSNHSIGLHQEVSEFLVLSKPPPPLSPQSTAIIFELPPEEEFSQLTLSPSNEFVISVTNHGSVSVHRTSAPYTAIVTMKGCQVHNSVAWTSFDSFAVLSEKNTVENWKIMSSNFCNKSDEKEKIIALIPIEHSQITCLMIRQESKLARFDFSKLLLSQISVPIDDILVASVLSSFTRHNERQIYEQVEVDDVSLSVEILLIFLRDPDVLKNLTNEKRNLVQRECELIDVYKQVVDLYTEKSDGLTNPDHPLMIPLSIISKFYESEKINFDFESFLGWVKTWPFATILADNFVDVIAVPARPPREHPLASYREFSHNIDSACDSILSPLVLRQSDPFIIRTVEKIFGAYWDSVGKAGVRTAAVQRWVFYRARQWYPKMIGNKLMKKFLNQFSFNFENNYYFESLVLLAILDEPDTFHKLLSLAPILLRFPRCPPTLLVDNHWRLLVAVSVSFDPTSLGSFLDKLKTTDVCMHQHFGQLGIDSDIFDALSEVKIVHEKFFIRDFSSDEMIIKKLIVLILLFKVGSPNATPSDIEFLLRFFNDLPTDSDKSVFGFEIIARIFPQLILEWINTVNEFREEEAGDGVSDVTALDSCISISRCTVAQQQLEGPKCDLIFHALSADQFACVERMQFLLLILRISLCCSWPCPIRRLFTFDQKSSLIFPTSINKPGIIDFLVSLALKSRRGSKLVKPVAIELNIAQIVYDRIITQLLDQCFDRDIEEFISGLTSDQFSSIVNRVTAERISVCIKMLAEDTSRLHGVIRTILTREEMEYFLSVSAIKSEKIVQEWIHVDGPRDVLVSCTRLANHPKLYKGKLDGRHESVAKKLIRAIDEI